MIYARQRIYLVIRFLSISCLLLITACKTEKLIIPIYQSGVQLPIIHKATNSPYGYHIFTPGLYTEEGPEFPLLVFLHGSGERGDSSVDSTKLDLILRHGPAQLINENKWEVSNSMIVASPQAHTGGWVSSDIHEFIEYLIANYKVNTDRIYLTGLSMGGYGIYNYVGRYGDKGYAAAYIPICGAGNTENAKNFLNIPLWAFHGESDDTVPVSGSKDMIGAINALNPSIKTKLTLYPGVGHNSWSRTYDGSGMGTENTGFDPFAISIYDWMFEYKK